MNWVAFTAGGVFVLLIVFAVQTVRDGEQGGMARAWRRYWEDRFNTGYWLGFIVATLIFAVTSLFL